MSTYDFTGDGVADSDAYDLNGDGALDAVAMDSSQDGVVDMVFLDINSDGYLDTVHIDANQDDVIETTLMDTDGDLVFDSQVAPPNVAIGPDGTIVMQPEEHPDLGPNDDGAFGSSEYWGFPPEGPFPGGGSAGTGGTVGIPPEVSMGEGMTSLGNSTSAFI